VGPVGVENEILGFDYAEDVDPAGTLQQDPTGDLTPASAGKVGSSHATPWPKGVPMDVQPDSAAARRIESAGIHASDTGADRKLSYDTGLDARQDNWLEYASVDPGATLQVPLARATRAQVGTAVAGFGSNDRAQSLREQNQYGYDSAHLHRRVAESSIPGNYMYLEPGDRPLHKSTAGYPNRFPTGPYSPFTGDDTGASFGQYGAVLDDLPGEYQAPPEPALSAPLYSASDGPDEVWW
jgi:hypothetical protein